MVGSHQVVGVGGEFWSPHKLLRRSVWHERDHIAHIQALLGSKGIILKPSCFYG
ncbi:MAG: hypothetical protein MUO67_09160 [Anaerolineales bacterium]|nr:hypothetical protein [Anaerolineales bacterium]